jgi:hypothetical protein
MTYIDQLECELVRVGQLRPRRVPRVTLGGMTMAAAVALSLVLAVLALAVLHHPPAAPVQPTSAPTPASARALVSQLAILRRPQTSADRTAPAAVRPVSLEPNLTRLAVDAGGLKVWVVVVSATNDGRWSIHAGDRAGLLARVDGQTYMTLPVPASALHDASGVRNVGGWLVQLVPDGVAMAEFSIPIKLGYYTTGAGAHNNVAVDHVGAAGASPATQAIWFTADGHRIAPRRAYRHHRPR